MTKIFFSQNVDTRETRYCHYKQNRAQFIGT